MSKLIQLTPFYKSMYWWLALVAFLIVAGVNGLVFKSSWVGLFTSFVIAVGYLHWLSPLARKAQLEADWKLPKTPRIPIA